MAEKILELKHITKKFSGVTALNDVSIDVNKGEVLALIGENGAGKSTLIKVIAGAHLPTDGEMWFDGRKMENMSPSMAKEAGISVIYQEHNLMKHLTVAENVFFGKEIKKGVLLNKAAMNEACAKLIEELGIDMDPKRTVKDLSIAGQQLVEIMKAVSSEIKFLIMDEPTAPLTNTEIDKIFEIVDRLKERGVSILYISHRLEEVFKISDRITVLRDGQTITTMNTADANVPLLIKYMVGHEIGQDYPERTTETGGPVLEVRGFTNHFVHDCSFTLNKGEILGLAGLVGAGRTELARAIFGADPVSAGTLKLNRKEIRIKNPRQAIAQGIGLITEDRKNQGLLLNMGIDYNVVYASLERIAKAGVINRTKERNVAEQYAKAMEIKAYSLAQPVKTLSGGNQQKVVLGKWLATLSDILIFDEPTRGIDVGAKAEIYQLMRNLIDEGKSIIMISSEMPELIGMSDRILVMQNGRIAGELTRSAVTQERILELATL